MLDVSSNPFQISLLIRRANKSGREVDLKTLINILSGLAGNTTVP